MQAQSLSPAVAYADYLAVEASSPLRHMLVDGVISAMAGGTGTHARLILNLCVSIGSALRDKPCHATSSDQRLYVASEAAAFYPGLSVICGPREAHPDDPRSLTNPTLLAEVLSPSTAGFDQGRKFEIISTLPSLRYYLMVDSERKHAVLYTRRGGEWVWQHFDGDAMIALPEIDVQLSLPAVYEGWEQERAIDGG